MPDQGPDREIELKLEATPEDLVRLTRARAFTRLGCTPFRCKTLNAVYFDTPDFRLMEAGFALRLREGDDEMVQTLKSQTSDSGPASHRGEWEARLPDASTRPVLARLPSPLHRRIIALAGNEDALHPRFETRIRRRISSLATPQGGEIEMVIDQGLILAQGREQAVNEIELELKRGKPADLYRLALTLADIIPLQIGLRAKSERGRALAEGISPKALRLPPLKLSQDCSLETAYESILRHCLAQVLANLSLAA